MPIINLSLITDRRCETQQVQILSDLRLVCIRQHSRQLIFLKTTTLSDFRLYFFIHSLEEEEEEQEKEEETIEQRSSDAQSYVRKSPTLSYS